MKLFKSKQKKVPQAYQPVLESTEIIDLFSRMTLMRLMSRNLVIDTGDFLMGYELDWSVESALIVGRLSLDDTVSATPEAAQSLPAEQQ